MKTLSRKALQAKSNDALYTITNMTSYYSFKTRAVASKIINGRKENK